MIKLTFLILIFIQVFGCGVTENLIKPREAKSVEKISKAPVQKEEIISWGVFQYNGCVQRLLLTGESKPLGVFYRSFEDGNLLIKANIQLNCGLSVINGKAERKDNEITLSYEIGGEMTKCGSCIKEVEYLINNVVPEDYTYILGNTKYQEVNFNEEGYYVKTEEPSSTDFTYQK